MKKIEFFKVEGDKIVRNRKHCPKCGPGVFIAEHKDRFSCGKCGYTEFKSGGKKEPKQSVSDEKPTPEPVAEVKEEQAQPEAPVDQPAASETPAPVKEKHEEESSLETPGGEDNQDEPPKEEPPEQKPPDEQKKPDEQQSEVESEEKPKNKE